MKEKNDKKQTDIGNLSAQKVDVRKRSSSDSEDVRFSERLKRLIPSGKVREISRKSGISEGSLRAYLRGSSEPGLKALVALAEVLDCRLDWLATGEGPERDIDQVGETRGAYQALPESFDKRMDRLQWATRLVEKETTPMGLDPSDRLHTVLVGLIFEGLLDEKGLKWLTAKLHQTLKEARLKAAGEAVERLSKDFKDDSNVE